MRSLIAAVRFLTRLRVPGPETRAADLPGAVGWYPLVGAACNAVVAGIYLGLCHAFPPMVAAVLAVAAGLLLTGGFHEDAVSDAADGLGGGTDRDRILTIMKDSRIGAYGAMALWVVLTLRATALPLLGPLAVPAFALAGALGRWSAAPLLRWLPAIGAGLAKETAAGVGAGIVLHATLLAAAACVGSWWLGVDRAPVAAAVAVGLVIAWAWYLRRRLGGQSGDLLGAGNLIVEAGAVLVLVAR